MGVLPPRSLALRIALEIRNWKQSELEQASGIPSDTISNYGRGKPEPRPEIWSRLMKAMGFTEEEAGRLLALAVEWTSPAREAGSGDDPEEASRRRIRAIAAGAGRATESFLTTVLARLGEEEARQHAQEVIKALRKVPAEDWRNFLAFPELHTAFVVMEVCEASVRAAADSPQRAREWAELALFVADHLPERQRAAAQGHAWAFVANAWRVAGKLRQADETFEVSDRLWQAGASDPGLFDGSRRLDLKASLRKDQRRPDEALELLDEAARIPGLSPVRKARLLLKKAETLRVRGDGETALSHLREAEPIARASEDSRLLCSVWFELAANLCELGRAAEAEVLLPKVKALTIQTGNRLDPLRALWLEGEIAAGLGRIVEAIEILSRARAAFADLGLHYDAAMLMVELAALYLQIGNTAAVKALIRLSAPTFESEGVHEEARQALGLFRRAVEQETVTLEVVRRLAVYLYRAQHDPSLRFESGGEA